MRICLVLEGSYPYVHGGVSTWMHAYIQAMPRQEFSLWVIGAKAEDRGKFVYELPPNVKEVEEVFLDDALRLHGEQQPVLFHEAERAALRGAVGRLSPRERRIMELRFGLNHEKEHTQKEVADTLGISQSYISRLEKRIIRRLRREREAVG